MNGANGLALEANSVFVGWVRAGQVAQIHALGGLPRSGRITQIIRTFQWQGGGGICSEGVVDVF